MDVALLDQKVACAQASYIACVAGEQPEIVALRHVIIRDSSPTQDKSYTRKNGLVLVEIQKPGQNCPSSDRIANLGCAVP